MLPGKASQTDKQDNKYKARPAKLQAKAGRERGRQESSEGGGAAEKQGRGRQRLARPGRGPR
jgi:hypothetical protein